MRTLAGRTSGATLSGADPRCLCSCHARAKAAGREVEFLEFPSYGLAYWLVFATPANDHGCSRTGLGVRWLWWLIEERRGK